jgi:hypothetical protein
MDMLDGADLCVLNRGRARDGNQRLAGRVRDHVEMEEALAVLHAVIPMPVDAHWKRRWQPRRPSDFAR